MTNQPPDLEEIIRRGQQRAIGANGGVHEGKPKMTISDKIRIALTASLILLSLTISFAAARVFARFDQAKVLIDRGVVVMDKLPAATDRMEKLLDRVDVSVQKGVKEIKEAAPTVTKGWIDGVRQGLAKDK